MKKSSFFSLLILMACAVTNIMAQDSLLVSLKEVTVVCPRENKSLKDQALSYTCIPSSKIESLKINSLHDLSAYVPNFFMPDYGSKITSSIYVRGVGSRMNEPSVGLYLDNIPYLDKSAFDFDFYDIQNIDLLRGPQGTLYGRNSIGGLIDIKTVSPFDFQGTKVSVSYGEYNAQQYKLSHYQMINSNLAYSLAGYYNTDDGYFTNIFNGEKNNSESMGGRAKVDYRLDNKWNMDLSLAYDHVNQNAYPYAKYDSLSGKTDPINYNEDGSYKRNLLSTGLSFQRKTRRTLFTSATGYQYMEDQMKIDQDFTADSIFALTQNQISQSITQEFVLRSKTNAAYQWVGGMFGFYKELDTNSPMLFRKGGLDMIQGYLDAAKLTHPFMPTIKITNNEMPVEGTFTTPAYGTALYHQSTYNINKKLAITGGLRLEYEKINLDYNTFATLNTTMKFSPSPMEVPTPYDSTYTIKGKMAQDFWELLPKVAIKYDFNKQYNIYASVSKGYKTGGYNFQLFSDVLRNQMKTDIPSTLKIEDVIEYKPEYTINYEIGTHTEIIKNKLFADMALFYIDYTDQQIVSYSEDGTRVMKNAGRSESKGIEVSIKGQICKNFTANLAYGYINATFKEYNNGAIDYSNNYVPMVPQNTLSLGGDYTLKTKLSFLDHIIFGAQYNALGKIYFTEENNIAQNFYGILNGKISFEKNQFNLTGWIKNALDEDYHTFYFESTGNSFVQKGKPIQMGVSAQMTF